MDAWCCLSCAITNEIGEIPIPQGGVYIARCCSIHTKLASLVSMPLDGDDKVPKYFFGEMHIIICYN
jgi:hypothetical protein